MYPYITYTIGITGCPLQKKKKKKEEAKEEKEEEVEATLQDGYEVEVTQQGPMLRRRSSRFESRPLF